MTFGELQETWQTQDTGNAEMDIDTLVKAAMTKSRKLKRGVFWRDVRECVAGLGVAAFFIWGGHRLAAHLWPWYTAAACCAWIAAFIIADRRVHGRPETPGTIREGLEHAIQEVDHQVRLLKNVLWWYLLPCLAAILLILGECALQIPRERWSQSFQPFLITIGLVVVLYPGIYWLNQQAVKKHLLPMQKEFEEALRDLDSAA